MKRISIIGKIICETCGSNTDLYEINFFERLCDHEPFKEHICKECLDKLINYYEEEEEKE
jgi:hypothetical protein